MMRYNRTLCVVAGTSLFLALSAVACSSDDDDSGGVSGGAGTGGTAGTGGSAGSAGTAGTGGTGGAAGTAGTGGGGTGGDAGSAGTGGGGGEGGSGGGVAGDHVLLSEIGTLANDAEFIEIWNPTDQAVDLSNYYVSDNSVYYTITSGPWNPDQTPGTDFVAKFPDGATIGPDEVVVIGANPDGYESAFGSCPDYFLVASGEAVACGGSTVPAMVVPPNGSVGDQAGALLSNDREMVILFYWDGTSSTVRDVDYVTWGENFTNATRVDKTGVAGYQADTPRANQSWVDAAFDISNLPEGGPALARSIERCNANEPGEVLFGGNGISGHDETSENLASSFGKQEVPTPGVKNPCL